jgi:glycosyltransferase involved in cell wall biosynthesis
MLAAAGLPEWPAEVRLMLVGDGVEQSKVLSAAARNRKIHYAGRRKYTDVPAIINGAIAGLSTQNSKRNHARCGFSAVKVYETLACGKPTIVTDFPGQAELIRRYACGTVIPPDNPRALAEAVGTLYRNPEMARQMGRRGREAVVSEHSWQHRADCTAAVIRHSISSHIAAGR